MTSRAPTKRQPLRTREAILAAATEEFVLKGYAGARIDSIAERAAINKRMLYHYFVDKTGLYTEVLEKTLDDLRRRLEDPTVFFDQSPEGSVRSLFRLFQESGDFVRIFAFRDEAVAGALAKSASGRKLAEAITRKFCGEALTGIRKNPIDESVLLTTLLALTLFCEVNRANTNALFGIDIDDSRFDRVWEDNIVRMLTSALDAGRSS